MEYHHPVSCHSVLTLGSCFKYKSGGLGAGFTMNPDGCWTLPRFSRAKWTPQRGLVHMETEVRRHFEHFHHLGTRRYQVCVWYSYCRQKNLGPVAVEPSDCPSMFQDLAEPETLEAEAAPVSKAAPRAARLLTIYLLNTYKLSRNGCHCLGKRLDAAFDSGNALQE